MRKQRSHNRFSTKYAEWKRWQKIIVVLAVVVAFSTAYILMRPATTLTRQTYCGQEEHTHSQKCYTEELVCGQEESDEHTHDASCYDTVLTCGKEEHTHDADCFADSDVDEQIGEVEADVDEPSAPESEEASDDDSLNVQNITLYANTLTAEGDDYTVTLNFDEAAQIPDNAELSVQEITDEERYKKYQVQAKSALEEKQGNDLQMTFARFFAMNILADGKEITPAAPVEVKVQYKNKVERSDTALSTAVYFAEDGVEIPDTETNDGEKADEFVFAQEECSVVGTVVAVEADETENTVAVDAEATADAEASKEEEPAAEADTEENPKEEATETASEDQTYSADADGVHVEVEAPADAFDSEVDLMLSTGDLSDKEQALLDAKHIQSVTAMDIHFEDAEKNNVEPNGSVKVNLSVPKSMLENRSYEIYHIVNGNVETVASFDAAVSQNGRKKAAGKNAAGNKVTTSFTTDSFSTYVVGYTVDFTYDGYTYRIEGESSIKLSELFHILGIDADVKDVESVEFSDESLVKVSKSGLFGLGSDWVLKSLKPFDTEETLTVTMNNGDVVTVKVTDDQATSSSNLSDFLTNASISAPTNSEGKYVVTPDSSYNISLTFAETKDLQFANSLTYDLSKSGLDFKGLAQNGNFSIKVNDGGIFYTISGNTFVIDENGHMTLNFNSNDPHFSKLTASSNLKITINFDAAVKSDADKITFKDGIEKDVIVDTSNSVTASKSATFNKNTGKVDYTVAVVSQGSSQNVVVKDVITGDALTLNANSIRATSSTGQPVSMTGSASGNSFQYTIASMKNGEVVTFTYSADVDMSKIHNVNGKYVTTGNNEVEVKSDGDPTPDIVNKPTTIDYTPTVSKSKGEITKEEGDIKTMTWTITANEDAKVSMARGKITDTIAADSQSIMKYSGAGITVDVFNADGTKVRQDTVAWDATNLSKTDSSWTYTVPSTDEEKAYKYVITYTTEVDMTSKTSQVTVNNQVQTDGGKSSSGSGTVTPTEGAVQVYKNVEKVDIGNKEITWTVSFNVPSNGLTEAVVKDSYPNQWFDLPNGGHAQLIEAVKNGSVSVEGLLDGEDFDVEYDHEEGNQWNHSLSAIITFYQNTDKTVRGLKSGTSRTVTVRLKTEINEDLLAASATNSNAAQHKNDVTLTANGSDKTDSATAVAITPFVEKKASFVGNRTVDGVELPVYRYEVVLTNVTSDVNDVEDSYDTSLLEPYVYNSWDAWYIFGGGVYSQDTKGDQFNYVYTADGMRFTTSAEAMPHDSSSTTGFYDKYKLVYYLTVKDETALKTIMSRAAASGNGKYTLKNTAKWNDNTDDGDVTYEYQGLKKEILTSDNDLKKTNEDIWADFRITLNPGAQILNDGDPLTMTDTVTNLSVDITSIQANPSDGVTWDMSGNTVTYTIPDATKVVITYKARVVFADIGNAGETKKVSFSNHAEMEGYSDDINKTGERHNRGEGSASIPVINLLKYEAGNMTNPLQGAVFALYNSKKVIEDGKESYVIDTANPVRDKDGNAVTFTTGSYGLINVRGDQENLGWSLEENTRYFLRETTAPVGYMLADFDYSFQISNDGTTDYSNYIYHTGDTMSAKNYPGTDVKVEKVWSDGNDKHDSDTVTVKLQQKIGDGAWSDKIREQVKQGNSYVWQDTDGKTITLSKWNDWKDIFNGLPLAVPKSLNDGLAEDVAVTYQVVETLVNNQTPSQDRVKIEQSEDGGAYVFTVTNTVDEVPFTFTKEWRKTMDRKDTAWPENTSITVILHRKTSDGLDSTYQVKYTISKGDLENGKEISSSTENAPKLIVKDAANFTFEISGLSSSDETGKPYTYYVTEETVSGYKDPTYKTKNDQTTDGALDEGVIINTPEDSYELPSTGGTGTTFHYLLGSILILGAGVMLWRRQRKLI